MAKSKQQGTQKGVYIEPCHYTKAKPVIVGDTLWFPLPRKWTVTLERGIKEPKVIDIASDIHPVSAPHAFFYKCGGATGDCVGSKTVEVKDRQGKKTGAVRQKTLKEIRAAMDERWQAIKDGTYLGVTKVRGIAIPEELHEGILVVQARIKKGDDWAYALERQYKSEIITRRDLENTLVRTLASYNQNTEPSQARLEKARVHIMTSVQKILAERNTEWDQEDNDILETN